MKHFWWKIQVWASDFVLEPLILWEWWFPCYLICLRYLGKEWIIFTYFQAFLWSISTEWEWPLNSVRASQKVRCSLNGPLKLFQLKWFIPSSVGSMEGLNIPKAQNVSMFHSWKISCQPFSVRASQKVSISYLKRPKYHHIFIFQIIFLF